MSSCKPSAKPIDTKSKLGAVFRTPCEDPSLFRSLAGALQYLTFTTPDISYIIGQDALILSSMLAPQSSLELHHPLTKATLVYCDNVSVIYLSENPVQHQRTKHVELDIHFVREKVALGHVRVLHVPSRYQIADIFTKGLPLLFTDFRNSLSVRPPPTSTDGVY
ncbi:hypothetical protein LIER_06572 [Lithospermum erythrorhizon]|uniref:Uncharacterized protein n=1 Tax=Lithospermum erythrorhizon TaxID=34254 RepID=A0AAV3P8S9_LITER